MNSVLSGLLHHTHTHTHADTHLAQKLWPVCLHQPSSSVLGLCVQGNSAAGAHFANLPTYCSPTGRCGWDKVERNIGTCLFTSPLYRGPEGETHVTTHPAGCSVFCDLHIPIRQPIAHTQTQTNSVSVKAVGQAQKKKLNRPDLLGCKLEKRIMGFLTPLAFREGSTQSPVCSLSVSLHLFYEFMKKTA